MTGLIILFCLIGFPLIELYFLIEVGGAIGGFFTIALTILTAIIGIRLIKIQGAQTLLKMQTILQQGEVPAQTMIEGVFLSIAAIFLVIPGFISDTFGALILIPPLRSYLALIISNSNTIQSKFNSRFQQSPHSSSNSFIDGEYEDITPKEQISIKKDN